MMERINNIRKDLPKDAFRSRNRLTFFLMELGAMDRRGDPSRYRPDTLIRLLEERPDTLDEQQKAIAELFDELKEIVRDYEKLKRV